MLTCVAFFLQQSKLWYKYFFELSPPMISHVWMGGGGGEELKWKYKKGFNLVGLFSFSLPSPLFFCFGAKGFKDIFCYQMEINSIV